MNLSTFIFIGDSHLKSTHPRNAVRLAAWDQIIEMGLACGTLAAWVHLGDLFDGRSSVQDRADAADRLQRMAARAPVVLVEGNHTVAGDTEIFGRLSARYPILVTTTPQVVRLPLATLDTAAIFVLPYPQRGGLLAAGVASQDVRAAAMVALDGIFMNAAAELEEQRAAGAIPLMVGHATIAGSVSSVGQPMGLEHEIAIDEALLRRLPASMPKVFGHIHRPQAIHGALYTGSICRCDFGETEQKMAVLLHCWHDGQCEIESRPLDLPAMYHVNLEVIRGVVQDPTDADDDVLARFTEGDWAGTEVRVRFSFPASERALIDESAIRSLFATAARLELEPIAVPDRALRAPEVATARTLAEKVDAWARLDGGRSVPASVLQKLAALEHSDATAVLSDVANQVAALENGQKAQVAA